PCLYILRFAAKLQFGAKTQQVANTALRLVQRMKRDSIHSGRRPSGLCGAALLMAARLHEFNRSTADIVKIVKVHESTLRKRLIEFGDTPSSALTLEEFMTVDLEEEQDPPSFKAARKKDKERLQKLMEEEADSITDLQKQIEIQLEKDRSKIKHKSTVPNETEDANRFIQESTMGAIHKLIKEQQVDEPAESIEGLGPDIASMGLANSLDDTSNACQPSTAFEVDFTFDDIDDSELDTYIMTDTEFECKSGLWHQKNADYLEEQRVKAEKLQKEREEGKPEKKRKRVSRKKAAIGPTNSAGEAIEKILQEKKISSKINYEVLKSLNAAPAVKNQPADDTENQALAATSESIKRRRLSSASNFLEQVPVKGRKAKPAVASVGLPFVEDSSKNSEPKQKNDSEKKGGVVKKEERAVTLSEEEVDEDFDEEDQPPDESVNEMGVLQMLQQHREDEEGDEDFNNYGYYEEEY
ncbi:hypothetical protein NQ315_006977, partial [Exocentrus adspersus]